MRIAIWILLCIAVIQAEEKIFIPKDKVYYISGIAFDTKTYCADFSESIRQQAARIKSLEAEVQRLRKENQKYLSEKLAKEHEKALKSSTEKPMERSKEQTGETNMIIISDKPVQ